MIRMDKLKVGLIGLGNFGELETRVLSKLSRVQLIAFSSRSRSRLEEFGKKYGVKKLYTEYKDMLKDNEMEAVFIVSDAKFHVEQALEAINNGKHVFLEKPLALNYRDGKNVVETAKKNNVFLMVGYLLRFEHKHAILKGYIENGRFGKLVYMNFKRSCSRSWFKDNSSYFHPVYETMSHDIDLALWYARSRVDRVYAIEIYTSKNKTPDVCIATITFNNGIVVSFETNWLIPDCAPVNLLGEKKGTLVSCFEALGTRMISKIELLNSGFTIWSDNDIIHPITGIRDEVYGKIQGALKHEINHFINCVLNNRSSLVTSVDDALYGIKIADAIVKSASISKEMKIEN